MRRRTFLKKAQGQALEGIGSGSLYIIIRYRARTYIYNRMDGPPAPLILSRMFECSKGSWHRKKEKHEQQDVLLAHCESKFVRFARFVVLFRSPRLTQNVTRKTLNVYSAFCVRFFNAFTPPHVSALRKQYLCKFVLSVFVFALIDIREIRAIRGSFFALRG
jgi:hypothetical protein